MVAGESVKLLLTFFMLLPRELMRSLQVERIPVYHHPRTHVVGVSAGGKMTIASVTATTFECYLYEIFHRRRAAACTRAPLKRHRECRPSAPAPVYAPFLVALRFSGVDIMYFGCCSKMGMVMVMDCADWSRVLQCVRRMESQFMTP